MKKKFLHVGCGQNNKQNTTPYFSTDEWEEVRLDMDESVKPDILLSMTELHKLPLRTYDAIYCAHALEHVYSHEVPMVLAQFNRLIKLSGHVVIIVPDLQTVCQYIVDDKILEPMYMSPSGPISPIDTIYGFRASIKEGYYGMAHRTGFTARSLGGDVCYAGFGKTMSHRDFDALEIRLVASLENQPKKKFYKLINQHFPKFTYDNGFELEEEKSK